MTEETKRSINADVYTRLDFPFPHTIAAFYYRFVVLVVTHRCPRLCAVCCCYFNIFLAYYNRAAAAACTRYARPSPRRRRDHICPLSASIVCFRQEQDRLFSVVLCCLMCQPGHGLIDWLQSRQSTTPHHRFNDLYRNEQIKESLKKQLRHGACISTDVHAFVHVSTMSNFWLFATKMRFRWNFMIDLELFGF